MPVYEYSGMNAAGKKLRGVLDADSPKQLRDALKSKGIFLIDHREGSEASASTRGSGMRTEVDFSKLLQGSRVPPLEMAALTRQLATLQRAGVPLIETLNAVVEQVERESLKRVLSDVRQRVSEGSSLANALAEHPKIFGDLFTNMVRAGESSGNLDLVLERLTEFLDTSAELKGKVMGALYYPIIMSFVGAAVLTFMFVYVIPKVTMIFTEQGMALPLITKILIGFTNFISQPLNVLFLAVVVTGLIVAFRRWKKTAAGRYRWDCFVLKTPVFGPTVRMLAVARFSKTLSTLLASGVPLLNAMSIVKAIIGNARLVEVIEDVRGYVREGDSIAAPLKRSGEFPPLVTHMIAIGERTGRLESMLDAVATAYERQVEHRMRALTALLEPAMIVIMGGAVGFVVFAILVPIMKIGQGIH